MIGLVSVGNNPHRNEFGYCLLIVLKRRKQRDKGGDQVEWFEASFHMYDLC
jgi:hypothetical protein